jgi:hypothetical protein
MTDNIHQILQSISVENIRGHIQAIEGVRHPVTAPEALERAANYIKGKFESLGYELFEHHFMEDDKDFRNILGIHRGTRQPETYVIVLAHFDSELETPGANDNASGVAAVLELARVLRPLSFDKSIIFAGVNLEENKLHKPGAPIARGSRALAEYAQANAWSIEGVIDLEEIAFASDSVAQAAPPMPIDLPKIGNFIGIVGNENSAEMVHGFIKSVEQNRIPLPYFPLVVPGNGEILPDTRRSDHAPFWDFGYKAIMITDTADFRTPHYHKTSDTLETLNLDFAANVCRATGGLIFEMAGIA